eukprot:Nitzschia sp. Nitz4//scaffold38_size140716//78423//80572//NITZ4_003148-RA/size140716-snap-gene-0.165-mRNA-1//-1//CDS//3329550081//3722//frame0
MEFRQQLEEKGHTLQPTPPDEVITMTSDDLCHHQHRIRTDGGGEFAASHEMHQLVTDYGYHLESTAPDASSQNGRAERPHQTLKNKTRCLLYTAGLDTTFWADALQHATWLYNRTYHSRIKCTPYEAYTGRQPLLDNLLTFGSRMTPRKTGKRPTTLDPHAYHGIFLGYTTTTNNLRYWDTKSQQEKITRHTAKDELHFGNDPAHRPPAQQHLIAQLLGTAHHHHRTDTLLDDNEQEDLHHDGMEDVWDSSINSGGTSAQDNKEQQSPPNRQPSAATSTSFPPLDLLEFDVYPFGPSILERLPVLGNHPTLGLEIAQHPHYRNTVQVTGCKPGSIAAKYIRRYKSRIKGAILLFVDDQPIHQVTHMEQYIVKLRKHHSHHICCIFAQPHWIAMTGEGIPILHLDQMNVITYHLRSMAHQPVPEWPTDQPRPKMDNTWLNATDNMSIVICKLTRRKLKLQDDWAQFQQSEYGQLDKYHKQGMFGKPCPRPSDPAIIVLPWVWTYLYKLDPLTFKLIAKARGTCNGGKSHGQVVTLEQTNAACLEQPAHRLFWAVIAALCYIVIGCDVTNAFAEADRPKNQFYMRVDAPYQDWWTKHLGNPPIPSGYIIPVEKNMQGHPEGPRLWALHITTILIEQLRFKATTHEPCLYYKYNDERRLILVLRQVDDFLIGAPTRTEALTIKAAIQQFMTNPLHELGTVQRFNDAKLHPATL